MMTRELTHLDVQAQCDGGAGRRGARGVAGVLAVYKRASVRAPLVSAPMTSAHTCGGRWSQPGALSELTGVGSSP